MAALRQYIFDDDEDQKTSSSLAYSGDASCSSSMRTRT